MTSIRETEKAVIYSVINVSVWASISVFTCMSTCLYTYVDRDVKCLCVCVCVCVIDMCVRTPSDDSAKH